MNYDLNYRSSRREVWAWYWRTWKKSLWRVHLVVAAMLALILSGSKLSTVYIPQLLGYLAIVFLAAVTISALVPQLRFKAKERKLEVTPEGWSTSIGKKTGAKSWAQIANIQEEEGSVVIQSKNGNALIVPDRAFTSSGQKESFLRDVKQWHERIS